MKAALIGAGAETLHTIKKAQKLGVTVTALDGNPAAKGLAAADEGLVIDISNEKEVLDAMAERKPDFVVTGPADCFLTTAGAVNDALGLLGISKNAAVLCTDKFLFHKKLSERGLRDCNCLLVPAEFSAVPEEAEAVSSETVPAKSAAADKLQITGKKENNETEQEAEPRELCEGAKKLLSRVRARFSWPVVLKPRHSSESREIFFLNHPDELETTLTELFSRKMDEDYILEEAVPGIEYGVDGAMNGAAFSLVLLRKKIITPHPSRQAVGYLSVPDIVPAEQQLRDRVAGYMTQVAASLGLKNCLFHADLMVRRNKIFIIELSAAPPDRYIHNVFTPMATGVDMAESFIRSQIGLPYSYQPVKTDRMLIHYFNLPAGKVTRVPEEEMVRWFCEEKCAGVRLRDWNCHIQLGDQLEPAAKEHSMMGRGYFVLSGDSEEMLIAAADGIRMFFGVE